MSYKLIQEYPGSPKLGYISTDDHSRYPKFWEKVKEVLIKTINGQPIYEGDQYYVVFDKLNPKGIPNLYTVNGPFKAILEKNSEFSEEAKYFTNANEAHSYVYNNKPVITMTDLINAFGHDRTYEGVVQNLLNIAKEKFN